MSWGTYCPRLFFPLDREGKTRLYIYVVYIGFSSLGKKSSFFEIFPHKESREIHRDFPFNIMNGKRERKLILSRFSFPMEMFPFENFPLLFTNIPLIYPETTMFFQPISYSFFRYSHIFSHTLYCWLSTKACCFKCIFKGYFALFLTIFR